MTDYRRRSPTMDGRHDGSDGVPDREPAPRTNSWYEPEAHAGSGAGDGFDHDGTRHRDQDAGGGPGQAYGQAYGHGEFIDDIDDDDDYDGSENGPWIEPPDDGPAGYRFRLLAGVAAVTLIVGGGAFWLFSDDPSIGGLPEDAPLIAAIDGPYKERPVDAGGLEVPHQNRQILQTLGGRHAPDRVESLLPGPEEPVPLPDAVEQPEGEGFAIAGRDGLSDPPVIPETQDVEPFGFNSIPTPAEGSPEDGADPAEEPASEPAVGFDGREDQIAALIEQMGILDDAPSGMDPRPVQEGPADQTEPEAGQVPVSPDTDGNRPDDGPEQDSANGQPIAATPDGGFRVQLGSVDSADAARGEWSRLSGRHSDLLGGLSMTVQEADISGRSWYRLQAGPLTREAAEQVCRELESRNAGCIVVSR